MHPLVSILSQYHNDRHKENRILSMVNKCDSRLTWDDYFIAQALITSLRSPSEKHQVGSVITINNRVISTGYNGYFSGVEHVSIYKENHEINTVHAEQNAIADAAKRGVSIDQGTIYVTHYPCINCAKMIIASGIKCVIYLDEYKKDGITEKLFNQAEVYVKKYDAHEL